ncbi:YuiB family protein [Robertmurraya andreesenii]|uniref:YuiB-like membrane protein n=1 Tax=Anoxybacillus andreesenii TaxID=1325932 RepID=A0ABT9V338_9BACL|nr:YuiB family protein [Robertmurraya andreesenii]MDQ0155327.1 hypothetical protein [Robertmurraya andreesenii]
MSIYAVPITIVSMLLFFVLFFGIGFILNMLLRMTWIMAIIYPIVVILFVDKVRFSQYFTNTKSAFQDLMVSFANIALLDILILSSGLAGAIVAGITIRILRKRGYQMF